MPSSSTEIALPPASGLRWLYVDFNSYFASVEQQLQPHLRGKPIAVVPVPTDATCAIAASYEAKAFGIKTGTPIWEAKQRCPELICVLAQHERYVEYHHRILSEMDKHIPVTAVCSIDEVACRLMDNETSVSRATKIAQSIKRGLAAHVGEYITCSIGIAPNRYLAKIAGDMQKPDGLTVLQPEDLPHRLLSLELADLTGIGRGMQHRLSKAGIYDMAALMALDVHQIRRIWGGVVGERMWHQLRGVELPDLPTTRRSIGHSHVMSPELRHPQMAHYVARRLTLKAASRLRRMEYYASTLSMAARTENGQRVEGSMRCYRAQDSQMFLQMMNALWTQMMFEAKGARIKKISVNLHGLVASDELQPELFTQLPDTDLNLRAKAEKVSKALDKINHRFGRDSILMGMLPSQGRSFSGTKIAFTRIPDAQEFLE